jgi:hypothetical protein
MKTLVMGKPWLRARSMGGGALFFFEAFATREECEAAISAYKGPVKMFPVYLPGLDTNQ